MKFTNLSHYNKFWMALLGAVAQVVIEGLPDTSYAQAAQMVLAVLTALGVYVVPNAPKAPREAK